MIMGLIRKRWGFSTLTIWKGEAYKVGKGRKKNRELTWDYDEEWEYYHFLGYESPTEEEQLRAIWTEVNVGANGYLDRHELSVVCDHIGMDSMNEQVCGTI